MANINKSGLYVVIKNVNQLKKTINIINTLKSGKEIIRILKLYNFDKII